MKGASANKKIPAKKFDTVSLAAKPKTTPKTPADARIPLILISQLRNIKYAPKIPIAIFPKLLKSGTVFFCNSEFDLVFLDAHSMDISNIFDTTNNQITIVIVLKIPVIA